MNGIKRNRPGQGLTLALTLAAAGALSVQPVMAASQKVPLPRPRPALQSAAQKPAAPAVKQVQKLPKPAPGRAGMSAFAQANVGLRGALFASSATFKPLVRPVAGPFAVAPTTSTSAADIARSGENLFAPAGR